VQLVVHIRYIAKYLQPARCRKWQYIRHRHLNRKQSFVADITMSTDLFRKPRRSGDILGTRNESRPLLQQQHIGPYPIYDALACHSKDLQEIGEHMIDESLECRGRPNPNKADRPVAARNPPVGALPSVSSCISMPIE
jgi:hypothetical protein